jgi:hypothetical protein
MRRCRGHRSQHREIGAETFRAAKLRRGVARRAHPFERGARGRIGQLPRREVDAVRAHLARQRGVAIHQHDRAVAARHRDDAPRERRQPVPRQGFLAQLDEAQSRREARLERRQEARLADLRRVGDRVLGRQGERLEHRPVRRQHRPDGQRPEVLPRERLALAAVRLAAPRQHAEEVQADVGVRIGEDAGDPGIRALDLDAELLVQLARQRVGGRLARFDLAAGELPPAAVDLAGWPLREQRPAVRADQDRDRNVDRRGHRLRRAGRAPSPSKRPA